MDKKLRRALIVLLAVVLAGTVGYIAYRDIDRAAGVQTYTEAEALAGAPDFSALIPTPTPASAPTSTLTPAPGESAPAAVEPVPTGEPQPAPTQDPALYFRALEDVDLEALRGRNPDVLGWIAIPGVLSYPLMRGQDNDFYLNHTWNRTSSAVGAIFMDCRSSADFGDFNTLIYGHRTQGSAMFGSLARYSSQGFWAAHPDVYLVTDGGISRYQIYAAYETELTSPTYQNQFSSETSKEDFISFGLERSAIGTGVQPGTEGRVITLSTCTSYNNSTRWVVQAVLAEG